MFSDRIGAGASRRKMGRSAAPQHVDRYCIRVVGGMAMTCERAADVSEVKCGHARGRETAPRAVVTWTVTQRGCYGHLRLQKIRCN